MKKAITLLLSPRSTVATPKPEERAVPVHSGEVLGPGLLRSILRDTKLAVDDLADLL